MARDGAAYVCQSCGAVQPKWAGQCPACAAWNSFVEEVASRPPGALSVRAGKTHGLAFEGLESASVTPDRIKTGVDEFDRVCGGGVVPGSAILLGGDPGVGKSTLLLQVVAQAAARGARCAYISGEEAIEQIRARAQRMGLATAPVKLAAETALREILEGLKREQFDLVIIDSIQTMWTDAVEAAPGTVTQVRAAAQGLIRFAKTTGAAVILVGHVTKDGQIAGPRVVEHMVDAVMSFEGDSAHHFRILRAIKNRFGATDEIGVFEMGMQGLAEVPNPSALFLGARDASASGSAVFAGMEGTRPMLVEIQALVTPTALGTPRRAVVGWDPSRLAMVLAVLEARGGVRLGQHDVYMNVAGGFRITEPAADLAVAAALVSSLTDIPIPPQAALFGEISLSGLIRPVPQAPARLKEAAKLGFERAFLPHAALESSTSTDLALEGFARIPDLVARIAGGRRLAREKS